LSDNHGGAGLQNGSHKNWHCSIDCRLRNPVLLAHSLATLDVISQGRLSVAVSVAGRSEYNEREFIACGVPFREKAGRLSESIVLIAPSLVGKIVCV
jgi:alkanesulfonate monooxygenase SsuD/methylene tetrahydromethanopterin reductase-like flavin-dependent oxidoreductase (luciferase family)